MMHCRLVFACFIGLSTSLWAADRAPESPAKLRLVGYLPDYRAAEFDPEAARSLTDLIVFSAEPTSTGGLSLERFKSAPPWVKLRQFKTRERVRLILCVGGWDRSVHFAEVVRSDKKRRDFVASAVKICLDERLDGLDLDWEHPQDAAEQAGYAKLLTELHAAFEPHGLVLSVTIAAWQKLSPAAFAAVDAVNVMSYDHDGRHSTLADAKADVQTLLDAGVPAGKITLGVPFYGRHLTNREQAAAYREILEKHQPRPDVDEIDGVYFNGPITIRRKTEFAIESRLGGVMVWELGQDARGDQALLRVIRDAMRRAEK